MRSSITLVLLLLFAAGADIQAQGTKFRSGIFLHHSTGYTIWGPNGSSTSIPREIALFNDAHGLVGSDSVRINRQWYPADSNSLVNEWSTWDSIFTLDKPAKISNILAANRIVVIKSCFPSSAINAAGGPSDTLVPRLKSIYNYKWHWNRILKVMESHPENFFVIWTNAPIVAMGTNDNQAANSDRFCRWAKDTLVPPRNVYVFDFFHKLADASGKLSPSYAVAPNNSHPNAAATALVAPQFVGEIFTASMAYESPSAPAVPSLVYPAAGAGLLPVTLTLRWSKSQLADAYRLQLAGDPQFQAIVADDSTITDTLFSVGPLQHFTQYYWRVLARNEVGSSAWSTARNFVTAELPPAPLLLDPPIAATGVVGVPILTWSGNTHALNYHLQVGRDSAFATIVFEEPAFSDTLLQIGPLESLTVYFWRVKVRTAGGESEWSPIWSFTTEASTFYVQYSAGWNIISIPVTGSLMLKESLFPMATSPAYAYEDGYLLQDTLQAGMGYWMKFPGHGYATMDGVPMISDTVEVHTGWNIVGSINRDVAASAITSTPPGIIASAFYRYDNGFVSAGTLVPGCGYWVKVNQPGVLIYPSE